MGSISGMVSQLTCCSLVSVMVRVSVSNFLLRLRRLRAFAHPPAGKAKQGAEQQNGRCGIPGTTASTNMIPVAV